MKPNTRCIAALAAAVLTLGACGGNGSPPANGPDPRVGRLQGLIERSDTLLFSSVHSRYSVTVQGETIAGASVEAVSCSGSLCVGGDGTATTAQDLLDPFADADPDAVEWTLGARGGFDTLTISGRFEAALAGSSFTLSTASYGFWGEHGFAALALGQGPLSGEAEGTPFEGDFAVARAYTLGEASGTNPTGMGRATWWGIAEAASIDTFERLLGTATVTIADLSRPRVSVAIDVPGEDIGAPVWADMPLTDGRFTAGMAGSDHMAGNFHGPDHGEAWGVFDTSDYVGAFGAKRSN